MRKELYKDICQSLSRLVKFSDGSTGMYIPSSGGSEGETSGTEAELPEGMERMVKHIDLWNHNVEFLEQEEGWERPAVFVEFCPIQWESLVPGRDYRAEPLIKLHVVTDWGGNTSEGSEYQEDSLKVFDLLESIHELLACKRGERYIGLDLVESQTNHNHEDLLENIEVYQCAVIKKIGG